MHFTKTSALCLVDQVSFPSRDSFEVFCHIQAQRALLSARIASQTPLPVFQRLCDPVSDVVKAFLRSIPVVRILVTVSSIGMGDETASFLSMQWLRGKAGYSGPIEIVVDLVHLEGFDLAERLALCRQKLPIVFGLPENCFGDISRMVYAVDASTKFIFLSSDRDYNFRALPGGVLMVPFRHTGKEILYADRLMRRFSAAHFLSGTITDFHLCSSGGTGVASKEWMMPVSIFPQHWVLDPGRVEYDMRGVSTDVTSVIEEASSGRSQLVFFYATEQTSAGDRLPRALVFSRLKKVLEETLGGNPAHRPVKVVIVGNKFSCDSEAFECISFSHLSRSEFNLLLAHSTISVTEGASATSFSQVIPGHFFLHCSRTVLSSVAYLDPDEF